MAKGEDAVRRKKNKENRKKGRALRSKESVSARVASIIASKRRRKSGRRRICEGMCYSLPTPDDPFNDRHDPKAKRKVAATTAEAAATEKNKGVQKPPGGAVAAAGSDRKADNSMHDRKADDSRPSSVPTADADGQFAGQKGGGDGDRVSKFLVLCLNAIHDAWAWTQTVGEREQEQGDLDYCEEGRASFLASKWGIEFWRSCCAGSDIIVDTGGAFASREQLAWLVSTASDIITRKEREGLVVPSPFLVFLVPSREKAVEVRSVCKPLKDLGIHTVSLHPGASVDHQARGLRSCEPEFLISTPERLLELISVRAIDISGVALLVLDGLQSLIASGIIDKIKSIREYILGDPQTILFSESQREVSSAMAQILLEEPVRRLSHNNLVTSQIVLKS